MLNLDSSDVIVYNDRQKEAIDLLIANRGVRSGKQLWKDKGPNNIFDEIKDDVKRHCLTIQKVRCAYCETLFVYGGVHIEHFADKGRYPQYLYEPLNLVCACPVCNGFANKGTNNTIEGVAELRYVDNVFTYVHPYLDDVRQEIKYKDPLKLLIDLERCSSKGRATVEMFHWDTIHSAKRRFMNLLYWSTNSERVRMINEILGYKE